MAAVVYQPTSDGYNTPVYPECPHADVHTCLNGTPLVFCKCYPAKTRYHSCVANNMGSETNPEDVLPAACPFGK